MMFGIIPKIIYITQYPVIPILPVILIITPKTGFPQHAGIDHYRTGL